MRLFLFEILRHRYTGIPRLLTQPKVIRVNQIIDLLLDGSRVEGYIVLGKKLLLLIVIDLIVLDGTYLRLPRLLTAQ
jgi:hypothetical protein